MFFISYFMIVILVMENKIHNPQVFLREFYTRIYAYANIMREYWIC